MKKIQITFLLTRTLITIGLAFLTAPSYSQENISQYLMVQSKTLPVEDHYAANISDNLNLDAQPEALTWGKNGKSGHCNYAKGEITEARDYDYGEATDLSDGLRHIDLQPVHTPKKLRKDHTYNTASSGSSMTFSVSSDCL
ncbi:hypothetical protein [Vibrio jasicida]|uniref:hypothetical protein n=1 Tax=Vibrio jasicida TaxID=766224 RepID=UPI0003A2EB0A|nr:hypothetical protein [Vibrio jasicida]